MKRIIAYSLIMLTGAFAYAQEISMQESISKSFVVGDNNTVEINNKYGDVIINSWLKDSVKITVLLEARGKDRSSIKKELDRAEINLRKYGNKILGETEFSSSRSGFFGELLDQASEASKNITKNHKISVDYQIWMPNDLMISLTNKFGDVYLPSMENNVEIELSYGNIRGNNCSSGLVLKHSFGKHSFDFVNEAKIEIRKAESNIGKANTLEYQSSTSEIELGKVTNLKINSRNDNFEVEEAVKLTGNGSFTDMNLYIATEMVALDFDYGEIFIDRIDKDFSEIALTGKSTDMNLILDQASYIDTEIAGEEDRMILPNSMLLLNKEMVAEEDKIILKGYVGNTNSTHGQLKVNSTSGDLIISIKETSVFTNKE